MILRPRPFMQDWLGEAAESVRAEGAAYSPIAGGRVPVLDARDVAAVAAYQKAGGPAAKVSDAVERLTRARGDDQIISS